MVTGIGVIGVFTATVASFFFEEQEAAGPTTADVLARLATIEQKVDALAQKATDRREERRPESNTPG